MLSLVATYSLLASYSASTESQCNLLVMRCYSLHGFPCLAIYCTVHGFSSPSGKFGVVYQCKSLATREEMAMKLMLKKKNKAADVNREVAILKKLDHPGIVRMTDFMDCEDAFVLVTEL